MSMTLIKKKSGKLCTVGTSGLVGVTSGVVSIEHKELYEAYIEKQGDIFVDISLSTIDEDFT